MSLSEQDRRALNIAQFVTPPTLEDNPVHAAVEAIVARHVRAALTEAAERVKRAGHGDEPLNDEARAVYGTHFYNDAARIVRNLSPDG